MKSHHFKDFLSQGFFPKPVTDSIPFGEQLNHLFFNPLGDNLDFPVHGPNVVRLSHALILGKVDEPGLLSGTRDECDQSEITLQTVLNKVRDEMEVQDRSLLLKTVDFLEIAALYHDVGKTIRRANHPQIGANLLRNFDPNQRELLVDALEEKSKDAKHGAGSNRFSRICSIVQHHDKFGVVSTGEGALPIFSDILYFASDKRLLPGILKNVTQVMLLNLADIAAVNRIQDDSQKLLALRLALRVGEIRGVTSEARMVTSFSEELKDDEKAKASAKQFREDYATEERAIAKLSEICKQPSSCLGLRLRKIQNVFEDWKELIQAIKSESVQGNRGQLKLRLLYIEENPARAITRILRLLHEAAEGTMHDPFEPNPIAKFLRPTSVETVLVGTLGAHQFQTFCKHFASVAKLDYGLDFFKAVLCACIRKEVKATKIGVWSRLTSDEAELLKNLPEKQVGDLAENAILSFVKVLECLVNRYTEVLDCNGTQPRRFGFQLRDLTRDTKIREKIVELLCGKPTTEPAGLTWIADEVTIWSMD